MFDYSKNQEASQGSEGVLPAVASKLTRESQIGYHKGAIEGNSGRKGRRRIMLIFPVVVQGDEKLKYVFPSKQRDVQKAIEIASADARIDRLILFGSAVTRNCGTTSDIDLAVSAPGMSEEAFLKVTRRFRLAIDSDLDILHYESIRDELLNQEIRKKGVTVYARST